MYLERLSNEILLQNISVLVKKEREITLEILHLLQEIERRHLFAELGFSSLFEYAVKVLHYSEGAAQRRISSMRLLRSLPELETKVESGALSLSALAQAQTFFRQEKLEKNNEIKKEILLELEGKSSREVERELIARSANPEKALLQAKEGLRPLSPNYSQLSIVIDAELLRELEELRALLAARNPHMSLKEVIEFSIGHSLKHLRMKPPNEPKASAQKEGAAVNASKPQKKATAVNVSKPHKDPAAAKDYRLQKESPAVNAAKVRAKSSETKLNPDQKISTAVANLSSVPPTLAVNSPYELSASAVDSSPSTASPTTSAINSDSSAESPVVNSRSEAPPAASALDSTPATQSPPTSAANSHATPKSQPQSSPAPIAHPPNSRTIPIQIKRRIWLRDQSQCTYVHADTGQRCRSTFNLQIDHIQPHAKGGQNSLENLRLLCRAHNAHAAVKNFGAQKMNAFTT